MKKLIFDSGPIITLTLNNLSWALDKLKEQFGGSFIIPEEVGQELIDKPLTIKKFKFEALQTMHIIRKGTLDVYKTEKEVDDLCAELLDISNNCFVARGQNIKIAHIGEMSAVATAIYLGAEALVIDERTTRMLIEKPKKMAKILSRKLHTKIKTNTDNLNRLRKKLSGLRVIRSAELVAIAYEMGILDKYLPELGDSKNTLLDALFWGVKLDGCSISDVEIKDLIKIEKKKR